jgi:PAS domain S-box-containing protein
MGIIEGADDAVLVVNYPGGQIMAANRAALGIYQYTQPELTAMEVKDLYPVDRRATIHKWMRMAFCFGIRFRTENVSKAGQVLKLDVHCHRIRHQKHHYLLFVARLIPWRQQPDNMEIREVAEPYSSHPALHWQEETTDDFSLFSLAFNHAPVGKALVHSSGKILKANPAFCALLEFSEQELLTLHLGDLTLPTDLPEADELFQELLSGRSVSYQQELRFVQKSGNAIWGQMHAASVVSNDQSVHFIIVQLHDVTERRHNEEALQHYASLIEHSDDAIYATEIDGQIRMWNPAAERMFGYTQEEIIGQSVRILLAEELPDHQPLPHREQVWAGKPVSFETARRRKDGKLLHVAVTLSPICDGKGRLVGVSSIVRDVTAEKRLQAEIAQLDRLHSVGELAASISHEVRNPMTTVRGYLQILSNKSELSAYAKQVSLMIEELDRMNEIITEFLSLTRNTASHFEWNSLNSVVLALLPLIEADALLQGKEIRTELMPDLPPLFLDEKAVRQMLLNLVRNGLEAMAPGKRLTITTYRDQGKVFLAVADQGPGISEHHLTKIGTPFFTTKERGTGLGLPVCYSIASRHRATVDVQTGPQGTTFLIGFPEDDIGDQACRPVKEGKIRTGKEQIVENSTGHQESPKLCR